MDLHEVSRRWCGCALAGLSVVTMLGIASVVHAADIELAQPSTADFELSRPEAHEPPPADFELARPEIEQRPPADVEPAHPEIAHPPPADFELSRPEVAE